MKQKLRNEDSLPKETTFGFFFVFVFVVFSCIKYQLHKPMWTLIFMATAAAILLVTLMKPCWLRPLNKAWYALGIFLSKLVSPIVLGAIFFALISPIALVMRLFRRDALRLRKSTNASYWIERQPPGPTSDSFINQF